MISFNARQDPISSDELTGPLDTDGGTQGIAYGTTNVQVGMRQPAMAVRRLVAEECEILQGFPRGYTNIPWRKQPTSPDGPRYKALGNSMATPVMAWIGRRIQEAVK